MSKPPARGKGFYIFIIFFFAFKGKRHGSLEERPAESIAADARAAVRGWDAGVPDRRMFCISNPPGCR